MSLCDQHMNQLRRDVAEKRLRRNRTMIIQEIEIRREMERRMDRWLALTLEERQLLRRDYALGLGNDD